MRYFLALVLSVVVLSGVFSQEGLRPLSGNPNLAYPDLSKNLKIKNDRASHQKTAALSLPFKEDFSYAPKQSFPNQTLWSDSAVFINTGYPIAPLSIGVATFDGLNKWGYPYTPNLFNMSQSLPADTLTSQAIDVSPVSSLTNVAISFYYQARGRGDAPEAGDSLILDFYKPNQGTWDTRVWFSKGNTSANTNDTIFKRGFVWLDTAHRQNGFKFRFRNKATTAGNFDHWHLDYIYLDKDRNLVSDTSYDDRAIAYIPTTFLARYYSMPWQQYNSSEKASKTTVFLRNNSVINPLNINYEYKVYDPLGTEIHAYAGGADNNIEPFNNFGWSSFTAHSNPPFTASFPSLSDSADFTIKHNIFRTGIDFIPSNDTVIQTQKFRNYYAYDDGSCEGGYYILGTGGQMAIKIKVNNTDTLRAVRIYFDPVGSITAAQSYDFRLKVWSSTLGGPAGVIYTDSLMQPKYYNINGSFKASPEYTLTSPLVLGPGEYFIGMQQYVASGITVGFDKNNDRRTYLYYDSGNGWTQSGVYGSLMMRPVFGAKIQPPVGMDEVITSENETIVYPNPANTEIRIKTNSRKTNYSLVNIAGQEISSGEFFNETTIATSGYANGIYFLILKSEDAAIQSKKIIVQH